MTLLAVAGLSARQMAEAAARDGFDVVALDLFGDADTRRAASQWQALGEPGSLRIDAGIALQALRRLAARGDVMGWVAGSGFEAQPELLGRAAAVLRLIGTPPESVRRLRDPAVFFGFLDAHHIAHPAICLTVPADPDGWLLKDARGTGGWHIRQAAATAGDAMPEHHYAQREARGVPMSATFIANGNTACVLGFNLLTIRRMGERPFVFRGVVGPVPLAPQPAHDLSDTLRLIVREFGLQGLGSLDFLLDGESIDVLEVNPRPPASMALYGAPAGHGVMAAHVQACLRHELPAADAAGTLTGVPAVRGVEIVFARRSLRLDERGAAALAAWPDCHDLPAAGTTFERGDPVCSLSASGTDARDVRVLLDQGREALLRLLETLPS